MNVGAIARAAQHEVATLARTAGFVVRAAPAVAAVYLVLVVGAGLLPVAQAWLLKLAVDALAAGASSGARPVLELGVLYALTLVAQAGLGPLVTALGAWLEDRSVAAVDRSLMDAGAQLADLYRIERPAFGDELRLLDQVPNTLPRLFPAMQYGVTSLVALVGLLVLLGRLHPLIPLAFVVLSIPHMVAEYRLHGIQYEALADRSRAAREMDYCVQVTTEPEAAKEVRVFGLGGFFSERFRERMVEALAEVTRLRWVYLRQGVVFSGLYALALGASFWYIAREVGAGRLAIGDVALYLNAIIQAQGLLHGVRVGASISHDIALHAGGFFRFLDSARPAIALPSPADAQPVPPALRHGIELRNVAFAYPESAEPVLADVSFTLEAGKVTALVGHNGAGKSTLVKLLTRMYDPTGGEILLDGQPLGAYDLARLRGQVGVVYQDFARFSLTLGENIAVGSVGVERATVPVEAAAALAGADEVASKLAQGYDTRSPGVSRAA